jgi:hypothetical protein
MIDNQKNKNNSPAKILLIDLLYKNSKIFGLLAMIQPGTRLLEYYRRVLRGDMLCRFSRVVHLQSLEIFMVLDAVRSIQSEFKYKTACLIELLSGKRPQVHACNAHLEGIFPNLSGQISQLNAKEEALRLKQAVMAQHKGVVLTAEDYKKASSSASGTKISSKLYSPQEQYQFLEKLREFYLPDMLTLASDTPLAERLQSAPRKELASYYSIPPNYVPSKVEKKKIKYHSLMMATDNPITASTTFHFKASDFLRFPDLEMNFEPLSSILDPAISGGSSQAAFGSSLSVYIRPILSILPCHLPNTKDQTLDFLNVLFPSQDGQVSEKSDNPPLDHLKVMNYFLARIINPFADRVRVGIKPPIAPQPLEHIGLLPTINKD